MFYCFFFFFFHIFLLSLHKNDVLLFCKIHTHARTHTHTGFHICDVMGYDPSVDKFPLTPKSHCSNCGNEVITRGAKVAGATSSKNGKNKEGQCTKCSECNHRLKMKVDYGCLTDALVWAYVFEDVGIDIRCNNHSTSLAEVVSIMPLARCYQRIDELGHNFWKLQCYFLTHLIYVFSDWGQHALSRYYY